MLNKNRDSTIREIKIEPVKFYGWLIERSDKDESRYSDRACFLLTILCQVSECDLVQMSTFLNLDHLYERLGESKMLAKSEIVKSSSANSVVKTAREYLREYTMEFFQFQFTSLLQRDSVSALESRLEALKGRYPLPRNILPIFSSTC